MPRSDPFLIYFLIVPAAVVAAAVLLIVVNAVSLRLAWRWLGMGYLPTRKAFHVTLIVTGTLATSTALFTLLVAATSSSVGPGVRLSQMGLPFWMSPVLLIYGLAAWTLGMATVCTSLLTTQEDEPLRFGPAAALAIATLGIANCAYLAIGFCAFTALALVW